MKESRQLTDMDIMTLHTKIDSLHTMFESHVGENIRAHTDMAKRLEKQAEEGEDMRKHVYGNGRAGITEQLRVLERFADSTRRIIWIMVPAIVLGSLALVWNMIAWYLQTR